MQYFIQIGLGFALAFVGLLPPGMLNMTAVRTRIEKDRATAMRFSFGAALVVIPQVYLAIFFANYFVKNPSILDRFSQIGVTVLFILSIVFFLQAAKKKTGQKERKHRKGNVFVIGILLSCFNMLAIPYYFFMSSILEKKGWLSLQNPNLILFVLGSFLGTLSLFAMYIYFASIIEKRAYYIAKNINLILGVLFLVIGIIALIK